MNDTLDVRIRDLASKLKLTCQQVIDGQMSSEQFEHWTKEYASRVHKELHGKHDDELLGYSTEQQRQAYVSSEGFANAQEVVAWCHYHKIVLDKVHVWWMKPQEATRIKAGFFKSNPQFVGVWRITNGVEMYIQNAKGEVALGHCEDFVKVKAGAGSVRYKKQDPNKVKKSDSKEQKNEKLKKQLMELLA